MKRNTKQALAMAMAFVTGFSTIPINTSATAHINANNEGIVTLPLGDEDYADDDAGISHLPLGDEDYAEEGIATLPLGDQDYEKIEKDTVEEKVSAMVLDLQQNGGLTITGIPDGVTPTDYYTYNNNVLTVKKSITISNTNAENVSSTRILVDSSAAENINITLNGVNIKSTTGPALEIPTEYSQTATVFLHTDSLNKLIGTTAGIKGTTAINPNVGTAKLIAIATESIGKGIDGTVTIKETAHLATSSLGSAVRPSLNNTNQDGVIFEGVKLSADGSSFETDDNLSILFGNGKVIFNNGASTFNEEEFKITMKAVSTAKVYTNKAVTTGEGEAVLTLPANGTLRQVYPSIRLTNFDSNKSSLVFSQGGKIKKTGEKAVVCTLGEVGFNSKIEYLFTPNSKADIGETEGNKFPIGSGQDWMSIRLRDNYKWFTHMRSFYLGDALYTASAVQTTISDNDTYQAHQVKMGENEKVFVTQSNNPTSENIGTLYTSEGSFDKMVNLPAEQVQTADALTVYGMFMGKNRMYWAGGTSTAPQISYTPDSTKLTETNIIDKYKLLVDLKGNLYVPPATKIKWQNYELTLPTDIGLLMPKRSHFEFEIKESLKDISLPQGSKILTFSNDTNSPIEQEITNEYGETFNIDSKTLTNNEAFKSKFDIIEDFNGEYVVKFNGVHINTGEITISNKDPNFDVTEDIYIDYADNRQFPIILNLNNVTFTGNVYVNADKLGDDVTINLNNASITGKIIIAENSKSNVNINIVDGTTNNITAIQKAGKKVDIGILTIDDKINTNGITEKGILNVRPPKDHYGIGNNGDTKNIIVNGGKIDISIDGYGASGGVGIGGNGGRDKKTENIRFEGDAEVNIKIKGLSFSTGIGSGAQLGSLDTIYIGGTTKINIVGPKSYGAQVAIGGGLSGGSTENIHITQNAEINIKDISNGIGTDDAPLTNLTIDDMSRVNVVISINSIYGSIALGSASSTANNVVIKGNAVIDLFINKDAKSGAFRANSGSISENSIFQISSDSDKPLNEVFKIPDEFRKESGLVLYKKENLKYGTNDFELRGMTIQEGNALIQDLSKGIIKVKDGEEVTFAPGSFFITGDSTAVNGTVGTSNLREFQLENQASLQKDGSIAFKPGQNFRVGVTLITPPSYLPVRSRSEAAVELDQTTLRIQPSGQIFLPVGTTLETGNTQVKITKAMTLTLPQDGAYTSVDGMDLVFVDGSTLNLPVGSKIDVSGVVTLPLSGEVTLNETEGKLKIKLPATRTQTDLQTGTQATITTDANQMTTLVLPTGTVISETEGTDLKTLTINSNVEKITFVDKKNRTQFPSKSNYWHEQLKFVKNGENNGKLEILDGTLIKKNGVETPETYNVGGYLNPTDMTVTQPSNVVVENGFTIVGTDANQQSDYEFTHNNNTLVLKKSGLSVSTNGSQAKQIKIEPTNVNDEFTLKLDGVTLAPTDKSPIEIPNNITGNINIEVGTRSINTLSTTGAFAGINHAGTGKLTIKCEETGTHICDDKSGHLIVTGGTGKSAIESTGPVDIVGAILNLTGATGQPALKSTGAVNINGGYVYTNSDENIDSIQSGNSRTTGITINTNGFVRATKLPNNVTKTKGLIFNGTTGEAYGEVKIAVNLELPKNLTTITKQENATVVFDNRNNTQTESKDNVVLTFRNGDNTTNMRILGGATVNAEGSIESSGKVVIGSGANARMLTPPTNEKITFKNNNSIVIPVHSIMTLGDLQVELQAAGLTLPIRGDNTFNIEASKGMEIPVGSVFTIDGTSFTLETETITSPANSSAGTDNPSTIFGGSGWLHPTNMTITFPQGIIGKTETGETDKKETKVTIAKNSTLSLEVNTTETGKDYIVYAGKGSTIKRTGEAPVNVVYGNVGITPIGNFIVKSGSIFTVNGKSFSFTASTSNYPMIWKENYSLDMKGGKLSVGLNEFTLADSQSLSRVENNTDQVRLEVIGINGDNLSTTVIIKDENAIGFAAGNVTFINNTGENVTYIATTDDQLLFNNSKNFIAKKGSKIRVAANLRKNGPTETTIPLDVEFESGKQKDVALEGNYLVLPENTKYTSIENNKITLLPNGGKILTVENGSTQSGTVIEDMNFIGVQNITLNNSNVIAGKELVLEGVITLANKTEATDKTITWSIVPSTGRLPYNATPTITDGNKFLSTEEGNFKVKASVEDGAAPGKAYEQEFTITVIKGTEVKGTASFNAGKVPTLASLNSEAGLTIASTHSADTTEGTGENMYTISRKLTEKTENTPKSVKFAITKKDETKDAISVTLNSKEDTKDLSKVGINLKATADTKQFTFELTGVTPGMYDIVVSKKNHTTATYINVTVGADKVSLETKMEMVAGDLNGDDSVNLDDYGALMSNYDSVSSEYDIDDDGTVNITDYSALMVNYDAKANIYTYTKVSN